MLQILWEAAFLRKFMKMLLLLNYLKATKKKIGLLINFGSPKVEIQRVINT